MPLIKKSQEQQLMVFGVAFPVNHFGLSKASREHFARYGDNFSLDIQNLTLSAEYEETTVVKFCQPLCKTTLYWQAAIVWQRP